MGDKSTRKWQHLFLYFAFGGLSLALAMGACAPLPQNPAENQAQQQLAQHRSFLAAGFFDTVIEQSEKVLSDSETSPPADLALYALGEVYADQAYLGRDYSLSRQYFEKLIENFPHSPLVAEAKTFVALYEAIAVRDQAITLLLGQQTRSEPPPPRPVVENRNFEEAVRNNKQLLEEAGPAPPAAEALYNLGLIYAHIDNPAKDYRQAQDYFARLAADFPDSPLAEKARIWLGIFGVFEKMRQIDQEIDEQKKQLSR